VVTSRFRGFRFLGGPCAVRTGHATNYWSIQETTARTTHCMYAHVHFPSITFTCWSLF